MNVPPEVLARRHTEAAARMRAKRRSDQADRRLALRLASKARSNRGTAAVRAEIAAEHERERATTAADPAAAAQHRDHAARLDRAAAILSPARGDSP